MQCISASKFELIKVDVSKGGQRLPGYQLDGMDVMRDKKNVEG